jgi:hypothetical protein
MKVAHGNAPVRHGAPRIALLHSAKSLFGSLVSERMQQRYGPIEVLLDGWLTGNRERHRS